jgi:hypothetical protein
MQHSVDLGSNFFDTAWTRLGGRWQPPALTRIEPLGRSNPEVVRSLICEVIAAHPADYALGELWQEGAVQTLQAMHPPSRINTSVFFYEHMKLR